jgi:hypothetical protein
MPMMMIKCPNTLRPVCTGIEADLSSFHSILNVASYTHCPLCGDDHIWWKREAWLADQPSNRPEPSFLNTIRTGQAEGD